MLYFPTKKRAGQHFSSKLVDPDAYALQIDFDRRAGKGSEPPGESHFGMVEGWRVADLLVRQVTIALLNNELLLFSHPVEAAPRCSHSHHCER